MRDLQHTRHNTPSTPAARTPEVELSERNRALQALNDLASRLLRINTTADVYEVAIDGILAIVGASRGAIAVTDDAHGEFRLATYRGYNEESRRRTDHLSYNIPTAHGTARDRRDIVVIHPEEPFEVAQKVLAGEAVQTAVLVPLFEGVEVIGVLSYLLDERRECTSLELEILRTASTYVGAALQRAQLYEAVEAERARLAYVLEQLPVGIFMAEGNPAERSLHLTLVNRVGQEQMRAGNPGTPAGNEVATVLHADGTPYLEEERPLQRALWTGITPPPEELVFRYANGAERTFLFSVSLLSERTDSREVVAVRQDITERRQLEEQIRLQAETIKTDYERLATLVNNVAVGLTMLDAEGRFIMANDVALGRVGVPRDQVLGRRYEDVNTPETARILCGIRDRVLATRQPELVRELLMTTPNRPEGTYLDWSLLPVLDAHGRVTNLLSVSVDVTEKVLARRELEKQRATLRTIIEGAPIGLALFDRDVRLVDLNGEYARVGGYTPEEVRGKLFYEIRSENLERADLLTRALAGESLDEENVAFKSPGGELRYYDVRYRPVRDAEGSVIGFLSAITDVTEKAFSRQQVERQRALLETVLEGAPVGIIVFDADMRVVNVNAEYARMSGMDPNDTIGRIFYEAAPKARPREPRHRRALAGEMLPPETVTYRPAHDTEEHTYDIRYRRLLDAHGNVTGLLSTALDLTEKVRAQREAESQRALLETIIDGAPVGLALYDREMRIVRLNAEFARLGGISEAEAIGRTLDDFVPGLGDGQALLDHIRSGEPLDIDSVPFSNPRTGKALYVDVRYRPVRDATGDVNWLLCAVVDVSQREELNRQKDEFIALASHELKTPVTAIKGYAQMGLLTAQRSADDRLVRTLRVIDTQANRLTRLINELLDVALSEERGINMSFEEFDLGKLMHEVASDLQLTAPHFSIDLSAGEGDTPVLADRHRIEQVLTNLMHNAIKYSGNSSRIEISLSKQEDEAVVSVRDFGVGIPAGQQEKVFERFFRASNVSSANYSGLGLGLFITRSIVTQHGGRIWLESSAGRGSSFYFTLPLHRKGPVVGNR